MNRNIIRFFGLGIAVVALSGCAVFGEWGIGQSTQDKARGVLVAYEVAQDAALIYGSLPLCKPETPQVKICRSAAIWAKIKSTTSAATAAIGIARPALRGDKQDAGEIADAVAKIAAVGANLSQAKTELGK
jgi:hypothetical protein